MKPQISDRIKNLMHTNEETQHINIHSIYIHKNTQVFNILQCQTLKGKKILQCNVIMQTVGGIP